LIALSDKRVLAVDWNHRKILNTESGAVEVQAQPDGFHEKVALVDACDLICAMHGGGGRVENLTTGAELSRFAFPYLMPVLCALPNGRGLAVGYAVGNEVDILH
jgi:hypothetical protein